MPLWVWLLGGAALLVAAPAVFKRKPATRDDILPVFEQFFATGPTNIPVMEAFALRLRRAGYTMEADLLTARAGARRIRGTTGRYIGGMPGGVAPGGVPGAAPRTITPSVGIHGARMIV